MSIYKINKNRKKRKKPKEFYAATKYTNYKITDKAETAKNNYCQQ